MFVDFDKVFNSKPQSEMEIPSSLISYLNKQLPAGVHYTTDEQGNCIITSDNGSYSIGGIIFRPTEEQKKVLGNNYTHQDILNYFYNAQKAIPLQLKKDGYITVNGKEISIEKLNYNPFNPVKFISGSFWAYPQPFPPSFKIKIGCEKFERELTISRVPNESVSVYAFQSDVEAPLIIKYYLDEQNKNLTMNVFLNLANSKTVRDIVESTTIYNAYVDGNGYFLGHPLDAKLNTNGNSRFEDSSIVFWEKVLKIEEVLNVQFVPPLEDVDFDTMCLVEQLYQNLINNKPTRDKKKIDSIDGNWSADSDRIKASVGKAIFFEFDATSTVDLFGVKKTLPCLLGIFNAVLSEYTKKGKKNKIVLSDESPEKPRYTSMICFKDESALKAYRSMDHTEIVSSLRDAKHPYNYIKEN